MANMTSAERHIIAARIKANLKTSIGMDMPSVNPTDITLDDVLAILDRMLIGMVHKGGKPAPKKEVFVMPDGTETTPQTPHERQLAVQRGGYVKGTHPPTTPPLMHTS